jgi:hypothetical protein
VAGIQDALDRALENFKTAMPKKAAIPSAPTASNL